ncbi:O-antigen ligase family protein [Leifsonia flava]|uniref:O-antigen ligase family protein n=1 Tax=Orlajensenia leifsoniae TaxID=2561933 RepID=A0A4Y9QVK4_9MICO|nr:O-antigen ligase family protein [Leifsonia flava]TFV96499.1 O-antigen ligase family protein [Leifsonia flava]
MASTRSRSLVHLLATLTVFTAFAGQFWRNLLDWWGFGIIAGICILGAAVALAVLRPRLEGRRVPKALLAFVGLCTLSIAWSFYPAASLIGVGIQLGTAVTGVFLALCLSYAELIRALAAAFRWILVLSLLFEAWVAIVVRGPVLPFWVDYGEPPYPKAFYWSRGLLLDGGPIEGIVANRNLLGFIALLALLVFVVQLVEGTVRRGWAIFWVVVAAVVFALTRSTTVILALVVVAAALGFALWARSRGAERRRPVYLTAAASVVAVVVLLITLNGALLKLFGKSEDLTGRFDIWNAVIGLAQQRPVAGWGWMGYWAPWVEPFDGLAVRKGVTYLQAHNAWLDVWLQVGIIGLVIFIALIGSTLWRSWFAAVDRPRTGISDTDPYTARSLLPLLILAALLAQSLAESRILYEGGWMLVVALCIITKRAQYSAVEAPDAASAPVSSDSGRMR